MEYNPQPTPAIEHARGPAHLHSTPQTARLYAGVDIGGTKTAIVLSRELPRVLCRKVFPTRPLDGPRSACMRIVAATQDALASQQLEPHELTAIGVSCGGPLDPVKGLIQGPPNLPGWDDVPIVAWLRDEFGVPVSLENDANAGALAEFHFGAGRGSRNMIFLTMGTGLGGGIVLNGELYRGSSFLAGEIGHVRLTRSGPSGYGKTGSAEGWASGAGLAKVARQLQRRAERARGAAAASSPMPSAREIAEAASAGNVLAREAIALCGRRLGEALGILIDLLNPDRIVIGGLAVRLGDAVLAPAREAARREALPGAFAACTILPAELGEATGDIAALCVARQA